jgi:polyribonucleotide nucleotidyltransferase
VHISKLSRGHITQVTDVLKEGQEIEVKLLEVDKMGRLNLSYIDAIDPNGAPAEDQRPPPRRDGPPRYDRDRGDRDRGGGGRDRPRRW